MKQVAARYVAFWHHFLKVRKLFQLTETPGRCDVFSLISALISWRSNNVLPQDGHETYSCSEVCKNVMETSYRLVRNTLKTCLKWLFRCLKESFQHTLNFILGRKVLTVFVFLILQPCSKLKDVFLMKSKSLSGASNRTPSPRPSTKRAPALEPAPITKSSL